MINWYGTFLLNLHFHCRYNSTAWLLLKYKNKTIKKLKKKIIENSILAVASTPASVNRRFLHVFVRRAHWPEFHSGDAGDQYNWDPQHHSPKKEEGGKKICASGDALSIRGTWLHSQFINRKKELSEALNYFFHMSLSIREIKVKALFIYRH